MASLPSPGEGRRRGEGNTEGKERQGPAARNWWSCTRASIRVPHMGVVLHEETPVHATGICKHSWRQQESEATKLHPERTAIRQCSLSSHREHCAIYKNQVGLYVLTWEDLQSIMLTESGKPKDNTHGLLHRKRKGSIYSHTHLCAYVHMNIHSRLEQRHGQRCGQMCTGYF